MTKQLQNYSNHKIHVVHVVPTLGVGGMELALSRVLKGLDATIMKHTVICLKGEALIKHHLGESVRIYCMRSRPNEATLPFRLWRLLREIRPTIIHARNWGAWPDVAISKLLLWPPVPLIFSFHGSDETKSIPLRRRLISRGLARITNRIVTVSDAARRFMAEELSIPADRVSVIRNGVDTDRFSPRETQEKINDPIVVGTVGNLTPVKNQGVLIRALSRLLNDGLKVELRIAGEGPQREELTKLATCLGIPNNVDLLGHLDDVSGFLRQLDIFVLPSFNEANPNALLEAMASGLACVGSRVGGIEELLDEGCVGRLTEVNNEADLACAIAELIQNPSLRANLGQAAREHVCRNYDMKQMIAAYDSLYREVGRYASVFKNMKGDSLEPKDYRPRVLMLGPLPPPTGGMAIVVNNLQRSALAKLCKLTVMNTGKTTADNRRIVEGILAQLRLMIKLMSSIRRENLKFVHIHTCSGFTFWRDCIHMFIGRLLGCQIVWHIHGAYFDRFVGSLNPVRETILRICFENAASVIVLSEEWKRKLQSVAPKARWCIVPNGVDIPQHVNKAKSDRTHFLFLGDLSKRKGIYDLIEAIVKAQSRGFKGVIYVAGGETMPGERYEVEQVIQKFGCQDRILLLGRISGEEKNRALKEADCLLLPSHAEGLPVAILEGMAYALPIIATKVGAIPEVITDGKEGFLIAPQDVEALADRLLQIEDDPNLRLDMGQAARRRVELCYTLDGMVDRLVNIYRGLF
jgi:glycosyltransferase involved in cell wall biosynthesis